jgi:hypothetical protein
MAMERQSITGMEYDKFVESPSRPGKSAVEISGTLTSSPGPFSPPSNSTCYTYSLGVDGIYFTEVYSFYSGGTPASPTGLLKTITIYYSDSGRLTEVGGVVS